MDGTRCAARRDFTATAELCPERDDCERFHAWQAGGCGRVVATLWLCETDEFESKIQAVLR